MKLYATQLKNGKIAVINGTQCEFRYCREYGCDFPACATFSGEEFDTEDEAKRVHPDLEIVK